ncbi:hypothetical protein Tco_0227719 [Tanacetum coccineum]
MLKGGRSSSKSLSTMLSQSRLSLPRDGHLKEHLKQVEKLLLFSEAVKAGHSRYCWIGNGKSTPHLPKINLVHEDNGEKFVLDDDFNIMMEESKDADVIISV